jgi:two-component system cell cycle response regulator
VDITLSKPKTVSLLLLEDDREYAQLVRDLLDEAFEITHVGSLAETRHVLAEISPDCILADLTLPDAHWLEAPTELRALAPDVPVVILSGLVDESLAMKAVHEGAQDYLVKGHTDAHVLGRSIHYAIERKRAEAESVHEALFDRLTGLPNRHLFSRQLSRALARRNELHPSVAVLFVHLDDLELINDSLGRPVGRALVRAVGDRLRTVLPEPGAVASFGSGLFGLLSEHMSSGRYRARMIDRVLMCFEKPFVLESETVFVTARVGVAVSELGTEDDPETLIRAAEATARSTEGQEAASPLFAVPHSGSSGHGA